MVGIFKRVIGYAYEHWGAMSSLIVGFFAVVLAIFPGKVASLEKNKYWRVAIPIALGSIAITGYLVPVQLRLLQ